MPKVLTVLILLITMVSCETNTVYSETKALKGYWDKNESMEFDIPKLDSLKQYNAFIHLRNTNDYKYNNLFLIVAMKYPHGKTVTDTLEYRMANPDGSWLGTGIGSIKENKLWYKENFSFTEDSTYRVAITHAMRNNGDVEGVSILEGITDVGFSIEEVSQQ